MLGVLQRCFACFDWGRDPLHGMIGRSKTRVARESRPGEEIGKARCSLHGPDGRLSTHIPVESHELQDGSACAPKEPVERIEQGLRDAPDIR